MPSTRAYSIISSGPYPAASATPLVPGAMPDTPSSSATVESAFESGDAATAPPLPPPLPPAFFDPLPPAPPPLCGSAPNPAATAPAALFGPGPPTDSCCCGCGSSVLRSDSSTPRSALSRASHTLTVAAGAAGDDRDASSRSRSCSRAGSARPHASDDAATPSSRGRCAGGVGDDAVGRDGDADFSAGGGAFLDGVMRAAAAGGGASTARSALTPTGSAGSWGGGGSRGAASGASRTAPDGFFGGSCSDDSGGGAGGGGGGSGSSGAGSGSVAGADSASAASLLAKHPMSASRSTTK
mmetsp:Transcript_24183/g.78804  ORF Transcript_24183/g.78804 Transcript_24183/m.78804 type:complete len:297 (-) Transcript_24183:19-909(-)